MICSSWTLSAQRGPIAEARDHRARLVAGAVVNDDDLDLRMMLRQRALYGRPDVAPVVVVRDDDADAWQFTHEPLALRERPQELAPASRVVDRRRRAR
jgi:hypothetical protein